ESVEENGEINVTGFSSDIKLHFSGALDALKGLINPFKGHVDHFNIEGDDQIVNAMGEGGVEIPSTEFADDAKFVEFNVAGKDTIVTAGTEDVEIVAGEILAQIASPLGDIPATCIPDEKTVLATIEVEEPEEPEEPEDTTAPEITLNGDNPLELEIGDTYEEPGASAIDDVDGDVTVDISGEVDTSTVGSYEVVYTASDAAGNEATETRTVNIIEVEEVPEE